MRLPQVRARFEKVLEEVTLYTPHHMEEMKSIFDQEEEVKRISNDPQWMSPTMRGRLHLHVKAVCNELHNTLMAINEQDKLCWWKNTHRTGMPTSNGWDARDVQLRNSTYGFLSMYT
ncbi:unnamed protein product [Coregonus sp. 'balchen']|nr:unnamed protein product [Coregonus sp. 'balchen']